MLPHLEIHCETMCGTRASTCAQTRASTRAHAEPGKGRGAHDREPRSEKTLLALKPAKENISEKTHLAKQKRPRRPKLTSLKQHNIIKTNRFPGTSPFSSPERKTSERKPFLDKHMFWGVWQTLTLPSVFAPAKPSGVNCPSCLTSTSF